MPQGYEDYTKCLTCGHELGEETICRNCGRGASNKHNWGVLAAGILAIPYVFLRFLSGWFSPLP